MLKQPDTGWTCQKCGYAPFSERSAPSSGSAGPISGASLLQVNAGAATPAPAPVVEPAVAPAPVVAPKPVAPAPPAPKTVFAYSQRQVLYERQMWVEAGKSVRFSRMIPLSVLPPGEPIRMEVMVHNTGAGPIAATYYLALTTPNLQGMRLVGETPELPGGQTFDVTQTITTALVPGDYSLTMFCLPHLPTAESGRSTGAPPLKVMDSPIPQGLAGLYSILKVRSSLVCPNCKGNLAWSYDGPGGRPRAWACGKCGYRLESGML